MATWSMFFREEEARAGAARQPAPVRRSEYALRAVPFEDIYLHAKEINNSRLVRQENPRTANECWSTIGAVSAVAIVLITALAPSLLGVVSGYQIQALKLEQQRLLNEQRILAVEESALLSTERLEQLARKQDMVSPAAGQVYHLMDASAGTVAANMKK
jgi:cell division protein FtsL